MIIHGDQNVTNHGNEIEIEDGEMKEASSTSKSKILKILKEKDSKRIFFLITYNLVIIYYLCSWVTSTNSLALRAYTNTVFFNIFSLIVCLISVWVGQKNTVSNRKHQSSSANQSIFSNSRSHSSIQYNQGFLAHQPRHSINEPCRTTLDVERTKSNDEECEVFEASSLLVLGLEKYEVLALLVSSCLALMAGSLVSLEAIARISDQPVVHTGRLGLGIFLGLLAHLGTILIHSDTGLEHVVCKALPCPTLKGYNPILGGNMLGAIILCGAYVLIHSWDIYTADTAAAFGIIGLTVTSMIPLAFYTASVILQKLPHRMTEQLDKCLREALIIDGVLEFRNERFWIKSFGKLAGTLQVRVRKDANEYHVLENVVRRLSRIVSTLTIQEFHETPTIASRNEYCPEYYIDELLLDPERNEIPRLESKRKVVDDDVEIIKIDDVLGIEVSSVKTFTSLSSNVKNSIKQEQRVYKELQKPLTICRKDNLLMRNCYGESCNVQQNALLTETKIDRENFVIVRMTDGSVNPSRHVP